MSTDHYCPACRQPLTLTVELGALVLRCYACRAHAIERDSRQEADRREGYTRPWWTGKGEG